MKSYVRNTTNLSCAKILLTSVINRPILFPLQVDMGNEYPIVREYKLVLRAFPWCKRLGR